MIHSLRIRRLRGIRNGALEELYPLTVLVGPNNSGKSTCLEALALVAAPRPLDFLPTLLRRRGWLGLESVTRLFSDQGTSIEFKNDATRGRQALVRLLAEHGGADSSEPGEAPPDTARLTIRWQLIDRAAGVQAVPEGLSSPIARIDLGFREGPVPQYQLFVDAGGRTQQSAEEPGGRAPASPFAFLDVAVPPSSILESLAQVDRVGESAHAALVAALRAIDPALREIRVVPVDGSWIPYATYDSESVPLALVGDGMKRLFHVGARLAAVVKGVALLEEPECFQHRKSLTELARSLWSAVDAGTQIVLSTHSLEFLDLLIEAASSKDGRLEQIGAYRTSLRSGTLSAVCVPGPKLAEMREVLLEDLRA